PGDLGKRDSDARAKPLLQDTPGLLFRRGGPVGRPGEASPRPYAPGAGLLFIHTRCRQAWGLTWRRSEPPGVQRGRARAGAAAGRAGPAVAEALLVVEARDRPALLESEPPEEPGGGRRPAGQPRDGDRHLAARLPHPSEAGLDEAAPEA